MNYILVHGAWHGHWCWRKVITQLQHAGHQAWAPDLPGNGSDTTPVEKISLEAYSQRICHVIDAQEEPVILVGHSLGGLAITQAAEARPERVRLLVYLAAALLPPGKSLVSLTAQLQPLRASPPYLLTDLIHGVTMINKDYLDVFYSDCEEDDIAYAAHRLVPQAMSIYGAPISSTAHRFGKIPRVYITCLRDPVIPVHLQQAMYTLVPCQVVPLDTGHFPFFSAPEALVEILTSLNAP